MSQYCRCYNLFKKIHFNLLNKQNFLSFSLISNYIYIY